MSRKVYLGGENHPFKTLVSPIVANLYIEEVERRALNSFKGLPPIFKEEDT